MNINEAETIAKQLIVEHCSDFMFEWSRGVKTLGMCYYDRKLIVISKPYVELNPEHDVRDTILHEIAHALTIDHNHDRVWKNMCLKLGCTPKSMSKKAIMPKGKYVYECPECKLSRNKHRKAKRGVSCGVCCRKYNNNRYSDKYKLVLKE